MHEFKLRADDTCEYCGGLNPATILRLIEEDKCSIIPTDKNYKIYVKTAEREYKAYFYDFTQEQRDKFIELYNSRKMKLEYPGDFYVLPFFARIKKT